MSKFQSEMDEVKTAIIANGQSLSAAVDLEGVRLVAIQMPAAWDTAGITFAASATSGGTYGKVRNAANTELAITSPAVNEIVYLSPADLAGIRYIKVRSGTAASAVNQTAERTINLICRPV